MPTDDIAPAAAADEGARHAASRKTLLQRLHMPVGKAIALAAMPSAALMGMGFTSPLAKADPQPENPFRGESCVSVPDGEQPGEEPDEEPEERDEPEEPDEPEPPEEEPTEEPAPDPDPVETDDTGERERSAGEPGEAAAPEEAAEEPEEPAGEAEEAEEEPAEGEFDPRDPLGLGQGLEDLGDGLADLLTPGRRDEDQPEDTEPPEEPVAPEEPEEPEEPDEGEEPDEPEEPDEGAESGDADESAEEEPADEADEDEPDDEESADEEEPAEDGTGGDPFAPDAQGREPFPCPVEESVPGTGEQTPVTLPDDPWYLEATYLTLAGLQYHGVVNVTTADGSTKQVLKFTAEKVDIGDLHQIVDTQNGMRTHVATAEGSNSTFRDGTVTMYTERLEGNLFGVIPIVFDPEHQPPLDLPLVHFTDVFVTQAGQFGGTLTMQGMNIYHTHDGPTVPPA